MAATKSKFYSKRARQRQMAVNEVDMRLGTYPWPDNKQHIDRSGAYVVNRSELLRSVGLSDQYHQKGKALFDDPWYKEQVALEMARRKESFRLQSAKSQVSLTNLGILMMEELFLRVKHAPHDLSSEFLAKYGPSILRIGLEIDARNKANHKDGYLKPSNATQLFAQQLVYIDGDQGEKLVEQLSEHHDGRKEEIKSLVLARNALEREIVDGTVEDEGSAE